MVYTHYMNLFYKINTQNLFSIAMIAPYLFGHKEHLILYYVLFIIF